MINFTGWTIEERERYAYAEGLPIAAVLGVAVDVELYDELQQEFNELKDKKEDLESQNERLKGKLEDIKSLCALTR